MGWMACCFTFHFSWTARRIPCNKTGKTRSSITLRMGRLLPWCSPQRNSALPSKQHSAILVC
jgi:hypothetical protein